MAVDYTWPVPGAVGWGNSVDANLEGMEARLNSIENALAALSGSGTGPAGPPGPMPMRFCINGTWQARPAGTESKPIISVSVGQSNVSTPPNPVEGDVWLY